MFRVTADDLPESGKGRTPRGAVATWVTRYATAKVGVPTGGTVTPHMAVQTGVLPGFPMPCSAGPTRKLLPAAVDSSPKYGPR